MAKILIVDEAELFLKLERSFLQRAGFDLHAAATAEDLLAKAFALRPDLVLLHARSGGGECGLPCARRLHQDPRTSGIPVVLICDRLAEVAAPPPECDRVLRSPVDPRDLLASVSSLTGIRPRLHPRVTASLPVQLVSAMGAFQGRTKNVSATGVFVRTPAPPAEGSPARIALHLATSAATGAFTAEGVVVRRVADDPGSYLIAGAALRLLAPPDALRCAVEALLRSSKEIS